MVCLQKSKLKGALLGKLCTDQQTPPHLGNLSLVTASLLDLLITLLDHNQINSRLSGAIERYIDLPPMLLRYDPLNYYLRKHYHQS